MTFLRRTRIEAPAEEVFRWHTKPGALQSLIPPWERVEVEKEGRIREGAETRLRVHLGPVSLPWVARIDQCEPGRGFRDVQVRGPFARWEHEHRMVPASPGSSWLEDRVTYELPLGRLGKWVAGWMVRSKLERMFEYRHQVTAEAVAGSLPGSKQT